MYYINSNYEVFVWFKKFENVDNKLVYLIGVGLVFLVVVCFLIRDG